MTKLTSTPAGAVLVAIEMSKNRQEVRIERPEGGRRRRMTVMATRQDYEGFAEQLAGIGRPIIVGFEATGNYHRTLAHRLLTAGIYAFARGTTPANVRSLVGGKMNEPLIERNWPAILRVIATIAAGIVAPSQILRKLACYPRQTEFALPLREVGRVERTLSLIDWILDAGCNARSRTVSMKVKPTMP